MTKSTATPLEQIALKAFDSWLDYRIRHTSIPGAQICIRKKGEIIFSKAYGIANVKTKRPLKTTDMHHVASISKMFTGCALLILQEQGKLELNDKIIDYIPEFKKHKDKRFKEMTLRDVLTNRTGMFRDGVDCEFWRLQEPFMDKKRLIAEILSSDLIFEPGTDTKYSNVGFSLLGLVIEKITGQSYDDAVKTLVLKKLKTKDLLPDYDAKSGHSYADGHSRIFHDQPRKVLKHPAANAMASATGFCGTAEATSLFLYEYLFGSSLISKKTQKELKTLFWTVRNTPKQCYGLGIHKNQLNNHTFIGHSGGFPGFLSQARHVEGTEYIISANVNVTEMIHTGIMTSCIEMLQKVSSYFKQEKVENLQLAPIFMSNWGGSIGIVGKEKALRFFCDSWQALEGVVELRKVDKNAFINDQESGNDWFGEHHVFSYAKDGKINGIKVGGARLYLEKDFFDKKEKNMLA